MKISAWKCAALSVKGNREYQEDAHAVAAWEDTPGDSGPGLVCALADGMGGYRGGAEAARIAVTSGLDAFLDHQGELAERLKQACVQANHSVGEAKRQGGDTYDSMGCTLIIACLYSNYIQWVSVGDSILWIVSDGKLVRLNEDHSMAPEFDRLEAADPEHAAKTLRDVSRNMLRSALTGGDLPLLDVAKQPSVLKPDDWMIVASDGVLELGGDEILGIQAKCRNGQYFADGIIQTVIAKQSGNMDNTTVLVCYGK